MAVLLVALAGAPDASGAPPTNDAPAAAVPFAAYATAFGRPAELEALADLSEAGADPGVPACLGAGSFARTAWYRVDPAPQPRELTVEAAGRTLDLTDLAAFVQPAAPAPGQTTRPNA